ncbi:hypothetical protein ACL02S_01920 [Nocardia sp. 004]|uniref:hypothetical protein n=1 Tax=Nocardia sp. 004 TaxID=3385978 RepID=UPI00399F4717
MIGSKAKDLPAPAHIVWKSLVEPKQPNARQWLALLEDEVEPTVLAAVEPAMVLWSSLWPNRPHDRVRFDLEARKSSTLLQFTVLAEEPAPDEGMTRHLRYRIAELLFSGLRSSYGQ